MAVAEKYDLEVQEKVINAVKSTSTASGKLVNNQDDIKKNDNKGG